MALLSVSEVIADVLASGSSYSYFFAEVMAIHGEMTVAVQAVIVFGLSSFSSSAVTAMATALVITTITTVVVVANLLDFRGTSRCPEHYIELLSNISYELCLIHKSILLIYLTYKYIDIS